MSAIFFSSMLLGYSGAVAPRPLLTYAVGESAKRGSWAGPLIAAGHGLLEVILVFALAMGMSSFFTSQAVISALSVIGGLVIAYMGLRMAQGFRDVRLLEASDGFQAGPKREAHHTAGAASNIALHPARLVLGGAVVSIVNPYWALWAS